MKKTKNWLLILGILILILGGGGYWLNTNYLQIGAVNPVALGQSMVFEKSAISRLLSSQPESVEFEVESFVQDLRVPWSLVFTSQDRLLVTERPGRVRAVVDGQLQPDPIRVFSEVSSTSEEGLMGMTLDPDYQQNKYIYFCIAYDQGSRKFDKVVRVTDLGTTLENDTIIIDKIPAARFHAGCRLRFGPDSKLYISTGDATQPKDAQEVSSLAGKILRINADGSIPSDNPFPDSAVYSLGHRNPQGFDWHPVSGQLVQTEHGPSGNDGPGGGDELNFIEAGQNYGWPVVSHNESQVGMIDPQIQWTPAIAPASGMFYSGQVFPQFKHNFLFGMLRGEGIVRVVFDDQDPQKIVLYEKIPGIEVGRVREVAEGLDGFIYFTTSNQDGRGEVQAGDDQIYRLVPAKN